MFSATAAITYTKLGEREPDYRGKVRDVYDFGDKLLIVATDRLSAFDVILPTPIPGRGKILTSLSIFWFRLTERIIKNHLVCYDFKDFPTELLKYRNQLEWRSMLVHKTARADAECVVRGYITGSGLKEYARTGQVCGIELPKGLVESQQLEKPIFTPATKAPDGEHDENISFTQLETIVGIKTAEKLRDVSLKIYSFAHEHAFERGIIIADTKFEFGYLNDELILIDEILTPDSSRFWDRATYAPGKMQESFDKQFIRNWLASTGFAGDGTPPEIPQHIVEQTINRYETAAHMLMRA